MFVFCSSLRLYTISIQRHPVPHCLLPSSKLVRQASEQVAEAKLPSPIVNSSALPRHGEDLEGLPPALVHLYLKVITKTTSVAFTRIASRRHLLGSSVRSLEGKHMFNGSLLLRKIENGRVVALEGGMYTSALAGYEEVLWLT